MENKYIPISCHFYDELESLAVKRIKSKIVFLEDDLKNEIEDFIVDFKNINKEEFMILSSGKQIRLDKIVKVNDKELERYC